MNKSLFQITSDYENLFSKLEILEELSEEESQQVLKELEITEENLKDKASNYVKRITHLEGQLNTIGEEKDRLTSLSKSKSKEVEKLKKALIDGMKVTGNEKLDLVTCKLSLRKSTQTSVKNLEEQLNKDIKIESKIGWDFTPKQTILDMIGILQKAGGLKVTPTGVEVSKTVAKKLYEEKTLTEGIELIPNESLTIK